MKALLILMFILHYSAVTAYRYGFTGRYARTYSCAPGCVAYTCKPDHLITGGGKKCYERLDCFPEDASVTVENGSKVWMKNLKIGDRIKTVSNGNIINTEVKTFLKRRPTTYSTYLNIKTNTGGSLMLSGSHQIFVSSNDSTITMEPRFAESIKKGEFLFTPGKCIQGLCPSLVIDVERIVKKGAYVPLTDAGTLLVDDVFVSCYDSISHDIAHVLATPARLFPWLLSPWQEDGYSPLVQWGKKLSQLFIPTSLQFQDLHKATFAQVKSEL